MNDKLSQDDIDNLLKGNTGDIAEASSAGSSYLTTDEKDTLGEICNIFMGAASTTLSLLLSNKVEITTPIVCEYERVEESFVVQEDHVVVEIKYVEGLKGTTVFALKVNDTAIIADLMMGGSGMPEPDTEIGELQLSAVGEAMNQMVGSASTSLSSMFNYPINISHPDVKIQKKNDKLQLSDEVINTPIVAVKFQLQVGSLIDSEIIQILTIDAAKEQVAGLMKMMERMSQDVSANYSSAPEIKPVPSTPAPQITLEQPQTQQYQEPASSPYQTPPIQQPYGPPPAWASPPPQHHPQQQITVQPVQFASFDENQNVYGGVNQNLNLVMDVKLELTVELGRTNLPIKNVLELTRGSIIELEKVAGEPVELYANGKLIAKGEVVVIEDNFGLRITSIVSPEHRIKEL